LNKEQLIHVISAACRQLDCKEIYLLGSQAAYGSLDILPEIAETSADADLIPIEHPERADEINGGLGEFSAFHKEFKCYGHGLDWSEVTLPSDWKENLVDTCFEDYVTGETLTVWSLSLYDLCASKIAAGRPQDFIFVKSILEEQHISYEEIQEAIEKISEKQKAKNALSNLKIIEKQFKLEN